MSASRVALRRDRFSRPRDSHDSLNVTFHHGSHAALLESVSGEVIPADLDAVIVPTCRPVSCLRGAARLARDLGCLLVAMCSRSASATEAAALGTELAAQVLAIDTTGLRPVPSLVTTGPPEDPRFARSSDLSLKRNLGLQLARVAGWERVLFLDDDMSGAQPDQLRTAAGLLRDYRVVGLRNDPSHGFPDNSVVCHAFRAVGGVQDSFIGGGAVVVAPARISSFFPDVYNEDWFVFAGAMPAAVTGRVVHKPYDPFASAYRARTEEFGDCLAEGLFWLLDGARGLDGLGSLDGRLAREACAKDFWRSFLQNRRALIREVLRRLQFWDGDPNLRARMVASVAVAQRQNSFVTPGGCARYVCRWRSDVEKWQEHLANLPLGLPLGSALKELKLADRAVQSGG